jgi:prepilin-type N-terminal cleavage/methylation domain-containing protein
MGRVINRGTDGVTRSVKGQTGFTLIEVLITIVFVSVGIVAVLSSLSIGVSGVDRGRRSTTALFLSEQRMEEIKAYALSKNPLQGWVNVVPATFPAEAYGTIAGYPEYRRTVTITTNPGGAAPLTKQVEVWVFYRPISPAVNGGENSVHTATLVVAR